MSSYAFIKNTVMRLLILTFLILSLCACSKQTIKNELVKDYGFATEKELVTYINEHLDKNQRYTLGNGIIVFDFDNNEKELQLFPVYCNEKLVFLALYEKEADTVYLSNPELLESIEKNRKYLIIKIDNEIYFISDEKDILLYGDLKQLSKKINRKIKEIKKGEIEDNLMGIERITIKTVDIKDNKPEINEKNYYNDRILIRFTVGDLYSKIRLYEAFCHGRIQNTISKTNMYVFCFSPLNNDELAILYNSTSSLEYVSSVSLEERVEPIEPLLEDIDLSVPVTEKEPFE